MHSEGPATTEGNATAKAILIIGTLCIVVASALIIATNRFNAHEIRQLVDQANEREIGYKVIVHNSLLYTYSFIPEGAE